MRKVSSKTNSSKAIEALRSFRRMLIELNLIFVILLNTLSNFRALLDFIVVAFCAGNPLLALVFLGLIGLAIIGIFLISTSDSKRR